MSLALPFDPSGLDPKVVSAFDDLIAALQTWFNRGVIEGSGYATFTQPRCAYRHTGSGTQSIADSTDTSLTWDGPAGQPEGVYDDLQYDNGSAFGEPFVVTTSCETLAPPVPGQYLVVATIDFAGNATGRRELWLEQLSSDNQWFELDGVQDNAPDATFGSGLQVCALATIEARGDVRPAVRVRVYQNSGGALNVTTKRVRMIKLS